MRLLITGGSGLLGSNLAKMASDGHDVIFTYNEHPVSIKGCKGLLLDLKEFDESDITDIRPEIVIHSAALTNVDYCERHQDEASAINVEASSTIARACDSVGARMLYISTDSVFDGRRGNYSEGDRTNPINHYARTKLMGERAVTGLCDNHLIIRTNFYGWNLLDKHSLAEWAISKLETGEQLNGFEDVFFTPIFVGNLSSAILELCNKNFKGLLHISGSERCSKLEFIRRLAEVFGYDKSLANPISVDEMDFRAKRPKDTSLDVSKAANLLETKLLDVRGGLAQMKALGEGPYLRELKSGLR